MHRRSFLLGTLAAALPRRGAAEAAQPEVRVGLTPVFLDDQVAFLGQWRRYLEARLARPVAFIQRGSYREVVDALRRGQIHFAWVCGYPFVRHRSDMRLLAVPSHRGRPLYRSYLIVSSEDRETRSMLDLRDKVFAFSDPDSNSGFLYPTYRLLELQERPGHFFRKTFFTWAHRKVVEAVAARLAHGGAVDGYVWDTLAGFHPDLTGRTRVVERSPEFGFPPFVAGASVPPAEIDAMRRVLTSMSSDAEGRTLLARLNLDGFVPGDEELFGGIARMMAAVVASPNAPA